MKHDIEFTPIVNGKFVTEKSQKARYTRRDFIIDSTLILINTVLWVSFFCAIFYKLLA